MSAFEFLERLANGDARWDKRPRLRVRETVLTSSIASTGRGLREIQATFWLTDERLLFTPVQLKDVAALVGALWGLGDAVPEWVRGLPERYVDAIGHDTATFGWNLEDLDGVEAVDGRGLVIRSQGRETVFRVASSLFALEGSPAGAHHRDAFVSRVLAAQRLRLAHLRSGASG